MGWGRPDEVDIDQIREGVNSFEMETTLRTLTTLTMGMNRIVYIKLVDSTRFQSDT